MANKHTVESRIDRAENEGLRKAASTPGTIGTLRYSGHGRGGRQPEVKCSILGIISIMPQRRPEVATVELGVRSIQPNLTEISVQNSMDRFGPTGKVSKKRVHLLRWSSFPGRTGWNFG